MLTKEEKRWCKRLERCLKDMPNTLEMCAGMNKIELFPAGTIEKNFNNVGHMDNPKDYCDDYYIILKVNVTGSESQN